MFFEDFTRKLDEILVEDISPSKNPVYGTNTPDFDNMEIGSTSNAPIRVNRTVYYSIFKVGDLYFAPAIAHFHDEKKNPYRILFAVSNKHHDGNFNKFGYKYRKLSNQRSLVKALNTMGAIYIRMLSDLRPVRARLNGKNKKMFDLYMKIFNSSKIKSTLQELGYEVEVRGEWIYIERD